MYYLIEYASCDDMRLFVSDTLSKAQEQMRSLILSAMEENEESGGLEDIARDFAFTDKEMADTSSRRQTVRLSMTNMGATYLSKDEADCFAWEIMAEREVWKI